MHKLGTSYTMYFNIKNKRSGNLFVKPFRSRLVDIEGYFKHIPQYIHLNAAELFEPGWKSGKVRSIKALECSLAEYAYSSLPEYLNQRRVESKILNQDSMHLFNSRRNLGDIIADASRFYLGME